MKNSFRGQKAFVLFLFTVLFAVSLNFQIRAQNKKPFKFKEIIAKLKENSSAENQQKIVKEICERGTDEELNAKNEKLLRDAGANDSVIKTIRERFIVQKEKESLYELFVNNYSGRDIEQRKRALKAGREYLKKFENSECNTDDPLIPYFKENLPILEEYIKREQQTIDDFPCKCIADYQHQIENFNYAVKRKDWKTVFSTGDEILKINPSFLDAALVLAAIGYEQTDRAGKSEYEEKAVYYAELAIKLIDKGEKSDNYGASFGENHNQDFRFKTKPNALGWMNYIIGYVKYFRQNEINGALPYFYKAANYKSEVQNLPELYRAVGDWYFEAIYNEETGKFNGDFMRNAYLERALDAYARAFNVAKDGAKRKFAEKIKKIYELRYSRPPNDAEIEKITTSVKEKPMPEPF